MNSKKPDSLSTPSAVENSVQISVPADMAESRVDKFLSTHELIRTRNRAVHLLDKNLVLINGKSCKASTPVRPGDVLTVTLSAENLKLPGEVTASPIKPLDLALDIVFEDESLLVVNKPAGLVVHPAAGHQDDTLVNALVHHCSLLSEGSGVSLSMKFGADRPGIVHRIDRETSGLLVVAKNDFVHENLSQQFKNKTTHRIYFAAVYGVPKNKSGTIQSFLLRHPTDRKKYSSVRGPDKKIITDPNQAPEQGKWAVTHYKTVLSNSTGKMSLLQLRLETGRTHQIRIHLSELGHPIVGDSTYGFDKKISNFSTQVQPQLKSLNRFYLHAAQLGFTHPVTNENLMFTVPWPRADQDLLSSWGLETNIQEIKND